MDEKNEFDERTRQREEEHKKAYSQFKTRQYTSVVREGRIKVLREKTFGNGVIHTECVGIIKPNVDGEGYVVVSDLGMDRKQVEKDHKIKIVDKKQPTPL